jgi:hypothetical protein
MSVSRVLLDVLIVLLAAKLVAEVAERARLPTVVGRSSPDHDRPFGSRAPTG